MGKRVSVSRRWYNLGAERGASVLETGFHLTVIIAAFGLGCLVAGGLADRLGRRRTMALFAGGCMALVVLYLLIPVDDGVLLLLGAPLGFSRPGSRRAWRSCSANSSRPA